MDLDIYYIDYVDKKRDWNVNSVNPLYLMINRSYGHIEEENGYKYLIITDISKSNVLKKYDHMFSGIKYHIKECGEYDKDYKKNKFLSDDAIPLNKMIYFPTITIIIRCVFKKHGVYYPQVYLDYCLYQI